MVYRREEEVGRGREKKDGGGKNGGEREKEEGEEKIEEGGGGILYSFVLFWLTRIWEPLLILVPFPDQCCVSFLCTNS